MCQNFLCECEGYILLNQILYLVDDNGHVLFSNKLTALPLKEESINKKSIEFYSDPEPCMIHRSAIMKYMYVKIDDFIHERASSGQKKILLDDLPDTIKGFLNLDQNAKYIMLK